jgi:hypothetical protein
MLIFYNFNPAGSEMCIHNRLLYKQMFFSKNKGPEVKDVIFLNAAGFAHGVSQLMQENPDGMVAVWFQHDLDQLRSAIPEIAAERFLLAGRLGFRHDNGPVLFAGHYPLRTVEQSTCNEAGVKEMLVFSHLDMPLLKMFGSEKIKEMMIKIGVKEDEPLNHPMITMAISKAQDKIALQNITDMHANSEDEWMKANVQPAE